MPRANEFLGILRLLGRFWVWLYVLISVVPIIKAAIFKVNWKANHLTALNLLRDKRFIRPLWCAKFKKLNGYDLRMLRTCIVSL